MSAPDHLSASARAVWCGVEDQFTAAGDEIGRVAGPDLEAYCVQVARMRDAAGRIDSEGLVVADQKGLPAPHPAIELERRAQAEVRAWGDRFRPKAPRRLRGA